METFVRGLMTIFSLMLGQPVQMQGETLSDALFAMFLTTAVFLAVPVSSLVVVLAMLFKHRLVSIGHAIMVFIILSAYGSSWVVFCFFLISLGNELAEVAGFYDAPGGIEIPAFQDVIGAIMASLTISFWGGLLMLIISLYGLINYVVILLTPLAFAISPLGRRSQAFFEWLISFGLVSMVFGRAAARFCVDLGRLAIDQLTPNSDWFVQSCWIAATFIAGIGIQFVLVKSIHRGIQGVMGRMTGRTTAKVTGKVESTSKRRQQVDVRSVNAAHLAALAPIRRQGLVRRQLTEEAISAGKSLAGRQARQYATRRALAKAAASGTPVGRAAATAQAASNRPHNRPRDAVWQPPTKPPNYPRGGRQ